MPRIFLPEDAREPGTYSEIAVTGEDAHYLFSVLRVRPGAYVTVCNGAGIDALCEVVSADKKRVELRVRSCTQNAAEPSCRVVLYQCLPKGDKFELVIQKAVELGAESVVPVLSERCIARPDETSAEKKLLRWRLIAKEAAKQAGRGTIPMVSPIVEWEDALKRLAAHPTPLILHEKHHGGGFPSELPREAEVGLLVGPEGGFSEHEVLQAEKCGILPIGLGKRILRTETAGLASLAVLMFLTGNFG